MKLRIVPLPDLTIRLLKEHIEQKGLKDSDLCFKGKKDPSRPITEHYVRDYMAHIIKKAAIQAQGRKLALNSFRYTYATYMRRELPVGTVMKLVGRTFIGMTGYCNKRDIDEALVALTQSGIMDNRGLSGRTGLDRDEAARTLFRGSIRAHQ